MANEGFVFPTGRIVGGNLYEPKTTDAEGRPLVYKSGPDIGKPREEWYFAVAIAKTPGQHWASSEWGAKIWAAGHAFQPTAGQNPKFAWKVQDGDSEIPNSKQKKNCDRVGYPGHWIVAFSSSYPPRIFNRDGSTPITDPGAVKPGYYVQVFGDVQGNGAQQQPGVFINHRMVALQAYGEEIVFGPDASSVGFGGGALPAGASAVPVGALAAPAAPPVPGAPVPPTTPAPGAIAAPPAPPSPAAGAASAPNAPPAPPAAPAVVVTPNQGILTGGVPGATVPGAPPPPPSAPVAPAGPQMTALAGGMTYEQYRGAGWNDQQLREKGLMV